MNERTFNKRHTLIICLFLAGVTLAVYWPILHHPFVNLDDPEYITENPHISGGISWENFEWALSSGYAANWHPLTWLSHTLDVQWFGLQAGLHHLTSLLFHAVNGVLLFLVLMQLTRAPWRSACVAALFALHPLHVESVAWAAERKDVLSGFFFILTLGAYIRFAQLSSPGVKSGSKDIRTKAIFYLLALVAFALGLMSKPMLVTVPCLLLLLDYWPLRRFDLNSARSRLKLPLIEKAPFFALAAASSTVTFLVQDKGKAVGSVESLAGDARIANAFMSCYKYLAKTFWPADLAVFYPHPYLHYPTGEPVVTASVIMAFILIAGISTAALFRLKTQPYFAVGWFWFLGMLVPVIGLVQVGSQGMADRYTYLPLIGIFVWFVWAIADFLGGRQRSSLVFWGMAALAIGFCSVFTWRQVSYWEDDISLFSHALGVTRKNPQAHFNLATGLGRQGKYEAAIEHFNAALALMPAYPAAHYNLGLANMAQGKLREAAEHYQQALQLEPGNVAARNNLGATLLAIGKPEAALEQYSEVARLQPGEAVSEFNLGRTLFALRRFAEAAGHFAESARLRPNDIDAHLSLGSALFESGRTNEATVSFAQALKIDPALPQKLLEGGKDLLSQGRADLAQVQFAVALRLQPENPDVHQSIARIYAGQGKLPEAITHFEQCLKLRPTAEAYYNMGLACVMAGLQDQARTNYEQAVKANPDWPVALNDLAWLLATSSSPEGRNGPEAVRLAERACQLSGGKQARYYGTLDAAYAAAGRFDDAIATADKTRQLAEAAGEKDLSEAAVRRIDLYKKHEPFRQTR